jgi:hypothetical protein
VGVGVWLECGWWWWLIRNSFCARENAVVVVVVVGADRNVLGTRKCSGRGGKKIVLHLKNAVVVVVRGGGY